MKETKQMKTMKTKKQTVNAVVIAPAIIRQGALVEVMDAGCGFYLVLKVNGNKVPHTWSIFLRASEIQISANN